MNEEDQEEGHQQRASSDSPMGEMDHSHQVLEAGSSGGDRVEVEADTEEIRDYEVVWGLVGSWPWWPGLTTHRTRGSGGNLLRKVKFLGEDDRGKNTHAYLVSF